MGQVLALGVEVVDLGQVGRLVLAPVHDQQLVPVGNQLLDDGLAAYGAAARWLAAGQTQEGDNLLRRGDRIGAEYRRLATRAGFRQCQEALRL